MKLLLRSIKLDIEFLKINLSLSEKINFLFKKYLVLTKNLLFGYESGSSCVRVFNKKYFYGDKYGVAFLQSVYVDNHFLKKHIKKNSIVVDVGANIGQFNFFCKKYLNAKRVYSFEPIEESYKLLKLNAKIHTYKLAISSKKKLKFYVPDTNLMATSISLDKNEKIETVEGAKLNSIRQLKKEKEIDLLKVDTEGTELEVVMASKQILKKSKYILVETSICRKSSGTLVELTTCLQKICPHISIVEIGRIYVENKSQLAVDILFKNDI